ncbi:hypothetical protein [Candidatus Igneacidithiobacillus taiwanensis]|uniref:hypothetical protein n=1 Tax=Candidatus Igneacidithiobacillus taiwanensis TaxID=1945924 RepID=UPI002898F3ED|nr:hypothetical protein [Candidatus Igneacidithiobacillus taiwanensis]MCE5359542.1 hypothetical protein [Acidithiobacillus sp.]
MSAAFQEGFDLIERVPQFLPDVEGSVITEMSRLGASLVYVYVPPRDVTGGRATTENDSHTLFWDFPGLSQTFLRSSFTLAMFLPVRWLLREDTFGVWMHTTIPRIPSELTGYPAAEAILERLAKNVQVAFDRVCGL